jgi:hypothetical protein
MEPEIENMPEIGPRGVLPGGESREIHLLGGRYISLAGGHATFHQQADRWPDTVNVGSVAAYANAMSKLAVKLAG